ncbi:MAG: hypothetical protein IPP86_10295 [Bacteroidetes bacterium]|nr:hypothetical protein [Bacteroidota bacterium]
MKVLPNGTYDLSIFNPIPLGFETTVGARYYFTDNIGTYVEAGLVKVLFRPD